MAWVFGRSAAGTNAFRLVESDAKDRGFEHSFGGKPGPFVFTGTGSNKPPLLILTLDLADPRLNVPIPGVKKLPLLFAFLDEGPVQYRLRPDGSAELSPIKKSSLEGSKPNEWNRVLDQAAKQGFPQTWMKLNEPIPLTMEKVVEERGDPDLTLAEGASKLEAFGLTKEAAELRAVLDAFGDAGEDDFEDEGADSLDWVNPDNPNELAAALSGAD